MDSKSPEESVDSVIKLDNVSKIFEKYVAVENANFEIKKGEFFFKLDWIDRQRWGKTIEH